ncbi:MAG: SAM-dependent methyltransferase [Bacteroidetes bacterium]|nr:SAM-dependent methyltransferase [Bacteroidota bacterium]
MPTPISDDEDTLKHLPNYNLEILKTIRYFVVENTRTARRFISKCHLGMVIDDLEFVELNEHTESKDVEDMLKPILAGENCVIMSEAGVPAIADPGAELVAVAHRKNVRVIPLVGPSSIIMSLMASGMNGQSFAFNGYLPIKSGDRAKRLRELTKIATSYNQSQIFIEAPYRNEQLVATILETLPANMRLTIAINISAHSEQIKTLKIEEWRKTDMSSYSLRKNTAIFVIGL